MTIFKCEKEGCNFQTENRFAVHTQLDDSNKKGWRYICCDCLGHESLSCCKV